MHTTNIIAACLDWKIKLIDSVSVNILVPSTLFLLLCSSEFEFALLFQAKYD